MFNSANIQTGMVVRDRDGERLGLISAVDAGGFFIGKGSRFSSDYRVAFSDVMDRDGDDLYLRDALTDLPGLNTGMTVTARSGTVTDELPLQHDLTGGLGVAPQGGLEDSAKFQDHGAYDMGAGADVVTRPAATGRERRSEDLISDVDPAVVAVRQPPVVVERRAALDEDEAPRRDAPTDFDPNTRR